MYTRNDIKCLVIETRLDQFLVDHELECIERSGGLRPEQLCPYSILENPLEPGMEKDYQAVIIGGTGDFSVVSDRPAFYEGLLRFAKHLCDTSFPTLGLCYGHQILAQAMGGVVEAQDHDHSETGTYLMTLTPEGRKDPLLSELPDTFYAQQGHHDSVMSMPDSFIRLAYSDRCVWQGMHLKNSPVYSFQFHPELIRADLVKRMTAYAHVYASEPGSLERVLAGIHETDNQSVIRHFIDDIVVAQANRQ